MSIQSIGSRIDALMRRREMSSEALAERISIGRAQIDHIRAGRRHPTLGTLSEILDALGAELTVGWRLVEDPVETVEVPAEAGEAVRRLSSLPADELAAAVLLLRVYLDSDKRIRALFDSQAESLGASTSRSGRRANG